MRRRASRSAGETRNWFLLLALVLCLEFWILVASSLANSL